MCHCRCAATRPEVSRRVTGVAASAMCHSPCSRASSSTNVSRDGVIEPGGRHVGHTAPPAATLNAGCGPGAAQRAQSLIAGAQPAWVIARRKNASSTRDGSRSRPDSARTAPTTSRYTRSAGSPSSATSRSAVSSTAHPAV
jgi:hypothetical protein